MEAKGCARQNGGAPDIFLQGYTKLSLVATHETWPNVVCCLGAVQAMPFTLFYRGYHANNLDYRGQCRPSTHFL